MHSNQAGQYLAMGCQLGKTFRKGEEFTHTYSGINSSKVYNSNFHKRTTKDSNSCANRQQERTFVSFGNFGSKQQRALAHQQIYLGLPSQQTISTFFRVLGVMQLQRPFRLEAECFSFPRDNNTRNN